MNTGLNTTLVDLERAARRNGGVIRLASDEDSEQATGSIGGGVSRKRLTTVLGELARNGSVVRAGTGRYILRLERGNFNALAAGPRLTRGRAYVSMWNVAEQARLTMNTPRLVSVVVDRQPTEPVLRVPAIDTIFYFHAIAPSRFFGFSEQPVGDGLTTPIAGVEKALVDMLYFVDAPDVPPASEIFGMWEEAASSATVNPRLLVKHVIRMDSPAVARRVGYFMERYGIKGSDDLLVLRGDSKYFVPLLGVRELLNLPANRWFVR